MRICYLQYEVSYHKCYSNIASLILRTYHQYPGASSTPIPLTKLIDINRASHTIRSTYHRFLEQNTNVGLRPVPWRSPFQPIRARVRSDYGHLVALVPFILDASWLIFLFLFTSIMRLPIELLQLILQEAVDILPYGDILHSRLVNSKRIICHGNTLLTRSRSLQ